MIFKVGAVSIIYFMLSFLPNEVFDNKYKITVNEPKLISIVDEESQTMRVNKETGERYDDIESLDVLNENFSYKDITVYVTYYTNINDSMQGGDNDKLGMPLKSHSEPVIAMPSDIPYGSYINIDDLGTFKVVDTGGAIIWLDDTTCKVDVFIPDVSVEWIYTNTENCVKSARLYTSNES